MIIKKKYTTVKRLNEITSSSSEPLLDDSLIDSVVDNSELHLQKEEEIISVKPEKKEKKKKSIDDLDLSLENIKFEQREERREGTRRRGYRRTQDRNVVSRAQKDAISIKEVAKTEGYNEGIIAAQQDIENLKRSLVEFFNYKEEVYEKVSECVMEVSVEIAKKIINKHIEADREYLIPIIRGVVEEINKTENKIILKVMPKDVEIVRDKMQEIFEGNYFEAKISVVPDNEIKDGGVIVETSNGLIDATLETQLVIIEKALSKQEES